MISTLLALAPAALAPQFGVPLDLPDTHRTIAWPGDAGWRSNGDFEQFVVARLTHIPDAGLAILRDGRAFLLEGMTSIAALSKFDDRTLADMRGPVGNLAVFPHAGPGGRDLLLSTDFRNGLVCHEHDDTATPGVNDFISTIVSGTTDWKRANCMDVAELPSGQGFVIVAGKDSNVVTYTWQGGTFTAGPSLTNTSPVRDVLVCNYDGVGDPEIVVVGDDIRVHDLALTSTPVDTIALDAIAVATLAPIVAGTADVLAIAHDGGGAPECELWIDGVFQQSVDLELPVAEGTLPIDITVTELSSTDWNDDGLDDLAAQCLEIDSVFVMMRDASGLLMPSGFSEGRIDRVQPTEVSRVPSSATPAMAASSGAGHQRNALALATGDHKAIGVVHGPQPVCPTCPPDTPGFLGGSPIRAVSYIGDADQKIFYHMPAGTSAQDFDYLEIATWVQLSEASNPSINEPVIEPEGVLVWAPIAGPVQGYYSATVNFPTVYPSAMMPPAAASWQDAGRTYWNTVRLVAVDNDVVVRDSSALHFAWRCAPDPDNGVPYYRPLQLWEHEVETAGLYSGLPYNNGTYPGFNFGAVSIVTALPETLSRGAGELPAPTRLTESGVPEP